MQDNSEIVEPRYLLVKRDLYYAPNSMGYTGIKDKAGRYFASDALPDCGVTAIHEDDAPDFTKACYADLARDHLQEKIAVLRAQVEAERTAVLAYLATCARETMSGTRTSSNCTRQSTIVNLHRDIERGLHVAEDPRAPLWAIPWDGEAV
ncbi:hypothetical protein [Croceicoccus sp. YJ47]|uniref:hypothetical protein n=1 Tax=Croceicoccus sp. YJ47 TaxID=2798724 RepID=UPI001920F56B|nr:hypothetical protein [Croceicoccus sp. YJ47]QQN73906.1 hypothetical protein JD971_14345 [Croceicoccus sp. YJ47]